jgi:hypothetical protein
MAKRKGGATYKRSKFYGPPKPYQPKNAWEKLTNEFIDPKSVLRQQFYQDGPIRTKGLDILNKVAKGSAAAAMAVPMLAPYAGAINAANAGAQGLDKAARMVGWGRRRKSTKSKKGSGKKRTHRKRK